jgi:hypothetical protein
MAYQLNCMKHKGIHIFGLLFYCKETREFQVRNNITGEIEKYNDIETCSMILYKILNNNGQIEIAE